MLTLVLMQTMLLTAEPSLPEGWRYATPEELSDEWGYRDDSPTQYAKAAADFNADGIVDEAFLLKSTRFSGQGLLLWLSCGTECFRWVTLDSTNWGSEYPNVGLGMGIDTLPPGTYEYMCVEVGENCVVPEHDGAGRPQMTIDTPSLVYFKFGSASSFFFWDHDRDSFIRVWTSD